MSESTTLVELVGRRLDEFCAERRNTLTAIDSELSVITGFASELLSGGKRFRALFTYWAWVACREVGSVSYDDVTERRSAAALVDLCAALEMFHAAALVHDDLMDNSDTRRGKPAVHKRFEEHHLANSWSGSKERFGAAGSILTGDIMLGWSSELFDSGVRRAPNASVAWACRDEFAKMRIEVMAGQYLDMVEENAGATREQSDAVARANRVMLYKTAKYSIEAPMLIGAAFTGASPETLRGLSAFAIPLGLAFQLRDDVLGVFGEPEVTGKPAGDDLREGKRTVLIALTREALGSTAIKLFDEVLGLGELTPEQIRMLQVTIKGTGALEKVEQLIRELGDESMAALAQLQLEPQAKEALRQLALKVIDRDH
jgi:geranylgeranyl diphosphate synthase type I